LSNTNGMYLSAQKPISELANTKTAIIEFGVNSQYNVGLKDSSISKTTASRVQALDSIVVGRQYVVGVTGL
jgi:hypothetical protein